MSIVVNCAIVYFTTDTYKKAFIGTADGMWFKEEIGFIIFVLAVEHITILIKAIVAKISEPDMKEFDLQNRVNELIMTQHEAAQSMVLEKRIRNGDSNAVLLKDRFARLDEEGLRILE